MSAPCSTPRSTSLRGRPHPRAVDSGRCPSLPCAAPGRPGRRGGRIGMSADSRPSAGPEGPKNQYRIESLAKGLQVLRLFDETTTSLKLREVVERTGLPMPTAFRIVATLEEEGFLDRDEDGAIHPGVAVLTLGSAALRGAGLVQASERPLRALAQATRQ